MSAENTAKYSDEQKLLTPNEYFKTAKENAKENKIHTETTAAIAKERNLVDADTAYKLNDVKYGAEAEAMGRMGLTGSGMGEYRQAEAYAQNRADRQASYAEYDRVMREAQHKYDQDMFAISGEELKYAEGERAAIDSSYDTFIAGINNGTMTMDQIMADSYYAKLSPEQQQAVNSAWTVAGFKNSIDNGTYKDEGTLTSSEEFSALTDSEKSSVKSYFASYHAGRTRDASAALLDYLEMASLGTPLDTIMAAAQANGHYDILNTIGADGKSQWDSVKSEADRIAGENEETENKTNIENAIVSGATLEDVQKMDGWNELSDTEQKEFASAIEERDEQKEITVDSVVANLFVPGNEIYSMDDMDTYMRAEGVPAKMREEIISRWQSESADRALKGIEDGSFVEINDGATLAENIKNGVYGDQGETVATKYYEALAAGAKDDDADIVDIVFAITNIEQIKKYLPGSTSSGWDWYLHCTVKADKSFKMNDKSKSLQGHPIKAGDVITDKETLTALNSYKTDSDTQLITVRNNMYYRDGDTWSSVVYDTSRPMILSSGDLTNAKTGQEEWNKRFGRWEVNGKPIAAVQNVNETTKDTLTKAYPNAEEGMYVDVDGFIYVYKQGTWRYTYQL